jgi:hypothetical protein
MTPELSASKTDRLAFIRYLANQGQLQLTLPEPTSAAALLTFHDAVELFLQLAAEHSHLTITYPKDRFIDYWPKLSDAGKPLPFAEAMKRLNDARVSLKHRGVLPRRADLIDFGHIVADFLQEATPLIFGFSIESVSLTSLVANETARTELKSAEAALSEEDIPKALEYCAASFDSLITSYEDAARDEWRRSPFEPACESFRPGRLAFEFRNLRRSPQSGQPDERLDRLYGKLDDHFSHVWRAVEALEDALRIVLLGLDYRRYYRFRELTPFVSKSFGGERRFGARRRESGFSVTADDVNFCIQFIVESALHLQEFRIAGASEA